MYPLAWHMLPLPSLPSLPCCSPWLPLAPPGSPWLPLPLAAPYLAIAPHDDILQPDGQPLSVQGAWTQGLEAGGSHRGWWGLGGGLRTRS